MYTIVSAPVSSGRTTRVPYARNEGMALLGGCHTTRPVLDEYTAAFMRTAPTSFAVT
jgi:hypothetical protein